MIRSLATLVLFFNYASAECPNACSSHGRCSSYDMCLCYRNWMSNDCSERVCQFGLAHVDSPKGDLDASSGELAPPYTTVIENNEVYPWGTSEQYPNMVDSNGTVLENTGHYYMECSNKGICDREAGVCECFPGYEGSACQRASCPTNENGLCSGHGTCQTIRELARSDYFNIYELWDKHATMGCDCDSGYYGADCSQRQCKFGPDPLYYDDNIATQRVANWTFGFYDSFNGNMTGNYSIIFYDVHGEDWHTRAIGASADCDEIIARLEELPNDVIPDNSVLCLEQVNRSDVDTLETFSNPAFDTDIGTGNTIIRAYTLVFPKNVGILKQPKIDMYLDGTRPSLMSNETQSTLAPFIYADGFHGEFEDVVADHCEGIMVTLKSLGGGAYALDDLTENEKKLFKRCLGDSDGDSSTHIGTSQSTPNEDVYDWDYGNRQFPHLIKLVEASSVRYSRICNTSDSFHVGTAEFGWCDNVSPPGFYDAMYFDGTDFLLFSDAAVDYPTYTKDNGVDEDAQFYVFTTKGTLSRRGLNYEGVNTRTDTFSFDSLYSNIIYTLENVDNDHSLACETRLDSNPSYNTTDCIEKGDRVMLFNGATLASNTFKYPNLYTVEKISNGRDASFAPRTEIVLDMGVNFQETSFSIYKFTPSGSAKWAAECSDRGICDASSGLCQCFHGYTSDDCSQQNALAQ